MEELPPSASPLLQPRFQRQRRLCNERCPSLRPHQLRDLRPNAAGLEAETDPRRSVLWGAQPGRGVGASGCVTPVPMTPRVSAPRGRLRAVPPPHPPPNKRGMGFGHLEARGGEGDRSPPALRHNSSSVGRNGWAQGKQPPRPPIPPTSPSARIAPLGTHRRATQSAPPRFNAAPHSGSDPAARIDADRAATCAAFEYRDAGRPRSAERGTGPGAARTAPHRTAAGQSYRERRGEKERKWEQSRPPPRRNGAPRVPPTRGAAPQRSALSQPRRSAAIAAPFRTGTG